MSVPNTSNYINKTNYSDKTLLSELKSNIQKSLEFFNSMYVQESHQIDLKIDIVINSGYEFIFKINSNLEFLHILDNSQTNKFKYEEALTCIPALNNFLNCFQDLINDYNRQIQKSIDLAKINFQSNDLVEDYINNFQNQQNILTKKRINIFNNYINQYILHLQKVNLIVKNLDIY